MPSGSPTEERYVVYSVETDDSTSAVEEHQVLFKDPEYKKLKETPPPPKSESPTHSIKWQSYWSSKEKCCCLWNFLVIIALSVLSTVIILARNSVIDIRFQSHINNGESVAKSAPSSGITVTGSPNSGAGKMNKVCSSASCVLEAAQILSNMNTSVDPCHDFYEFSCGGYIARTYLSWKTQRKRSAKELILSDYYSSAIDRLSSPEESSDDRLTRYLKKVYRSCLFRPTSHNPDNLTPAQQYEDLIAPLKRQTMAGWELEHSLTDCATKRRLVLEKEDICQSLVRVQIRNLLGANVYSGSAPSFPDLTDTVAMVMKSYGASPLFKVIVDNNGHVSLLNRYTDIMVTKLNEDGVNIGNFRFLRPSDYFYRDPNRDKILLSYKRFMASFTRTLFGQPPKHMGDHVFDNVFNLEVSLNKAWFFDDTTNYSDSFRKCSKQMTLKDLEMNFSGYMISWKELFSKLWNRNVTDNFVFCNVDLSTDAPRVLRHVDKYTIKRYIIVNAIMTSDVYDILPQDVPQFVRDGRKKKEQIKWNDGLENRCLLQITKYIPNISLFSQRIDSEETEGAIHRVFTGLRKSFESVFEDLYWIPENQRKLLLQPFDDVSLQYEWRQQNGSTFNSIFANFTATDNYFLNFHSLLSTWNSYRIKRGNVTPTYGSRLEKKLIDVSARDIKSPLFYRSSQSSVLFGSTGTYLAQTIAKRFDIDVFLAQYTNGLIDHQVAFTLAYRLQCLVDEFDKYEIYKESGTVQKIRGDLTKNKNLQDSLALRVVYEAWSSDRLRGDTQLPGLPYTDQQLFFITYAQTMCEKIDIRGLKRFYMGESGKTNVPYKYRVIGTLSNYQAFTGAFSCRQGTHMNPEEKCVVL